MENHKGHRNNCNKAIIVIKNIFNEKLIVNLKTEINKLVHKSTDLIHKLKEEL